MGQDKYQAMGDGIYAQVGGPLIHCMTRVRMTIKDEAKVNVAGLKKVPGVLGVVQEETLQVIVGPGTVNKVAQAMVAKVGVGLGDPFPGSASVTIKITSLRLKPRPPKFMPLTKPH